MVVWLCHARVGHRQGLYPETPSPATVGVFLCLAFAGATAGRDPKHYSSLMRRTKGGLAEQQRCMLAIARRQLLPGPAFASGQARVPFDASTQSSPMMSCAPPLASEGSGSCLFMSKHAAALAGIGPPCWW